MTDNGPGRAKRVGEEMLAPRTAGMLLYLLPLPLLFAVLFNLFSGNVWQAIGSAAGFAVAMAAATLVRKGITLEREAQRRKIVRRRSVLPYKLMGAGACGVAVFIAALIADSQAFVLALMWGAVAGFGCYLVYGRDPARKLDDVSAIGVTSEEVIEILDEADTRIVAIESAADKIHNLELKQRLKSIVGGVREITGIIEDDPRDLRRARKFLKVYLDGAQRVTTGYASTHGATDNAELEQNFRNVLDTIETVIDQQKQRLQENNLTELDVQIEVLQSRLEREGV